MKAFFAWLRDRHLRRLQIAHQPTLSAYRAFAEAEVITPVKPVVYKNLRLVRSNRKVMAA